MKLNLKALTVGALLVLGVTANHYWPRRDVRVSTDPQWVQVVQFIRSADEVKTFATKADIESETQLTNAIHQNNGELRTQNDRKELLDHLTILPELPGDPVEVAACFCPHHFVFATTGQTTLRIDICYSCGPCRVTSTDKNLVNNFPIKYDAKQDSGAVFGLEAGGREEGFGCRYFGG